MPIASVQFIAPTFDIARRARLVAREMGMEDRLDCHVSNLRKGLELAARLEKQGAEVFIARRGTADMIQRALSTPLVHVPVTLEDMVQALGKARGLTGIMRPKVAFFAMPALDDELNMFADLLDFELRLYHVVEQEDLLESAVVTAITEGAHVIVGGGVVTHMAQERGMPAVMLDSGHLSLRAALSEAMRIAYARTLEKSQNERFRSVVDNSRDGVLVLDEKRQVQMANPAALRILDRRTVPPGTPVEAIFPGLDTATCYAGTAVHNTVMEFSRGDLLVSMTPTYIAGEARGAIISFMPAASIAELGATIHKTQNARGFVSQYDFGDIAGVSPQLLAAKHKAGAYAAGRAPVLLVGETGTGKELFAHAIHRASPCCRGPFVTVDCASLSPTLLESELFGYEEGAFTGAAKRGKPGLFELAHRGSIFLDEISELDERGQSRLLRVLQEHAAMRIGGDRIIPLDIRVIAATNRNLWEMVGQGSFRRDLFFRLNVLSVFIPPLRERDGDVACLAERALIRGGRRASGRGAVLDGRMLDALLAHDWPGNVRELLNVMECYAMESTLHAGALPDIGVLLDLGAQWEKLGKEPLSCGYARRRAPDERERLLAALHDNNWHQGKTAARLGVNRSTLYRKMRIHGLRKMG